MSIDATRWAWQQRRISTTQKIVLLSMADRAGEDHTCWPSLARLCADTGLSDRAVQKAMADLETLGFVRRLPACGKVNTYKLLGVQDRESSAPPKEMHPRTTFTPEQDAPPNEVRPTPESGSPHPRTTFTPPPNVVRGESLREPIKNLPEKESAPARPPARSVRTGEGAPKQRHGEYGNVLLTAEELARLREDYGPEATDEAVALLDQHLGASRKRDPYKSHYLAMRKWVFDAVEERRRKQRRAGARPSAGPSFDELTAQFQGVGAGGAK